MKFKPFFSLFRDRRPGRVRAKNRIRPKQPGLRIEALEERSLLSGTPTIVAVTPPDGSTTFSSTPSLAVQFSEDMNAGSVQNTANYEFFGPNHQQIPITAASYDSSTFQVSLTYSAGSGLTAGKYTLLVNGSALVDAVSGLPISSAAQIAVANQGTLNVSVVKELTDGTLGAGSNYDASRANARPSGIAVADITKDGTNDLIMLNQAANTVDLYRGTTNLGFSRTPYLTLPLPSGASAQAIVVADLNNDGLLDIAVANTALNSVTIFTNQGAGQFGNSTTLAAGHTPIAILAADFNSDGAVDLVLANSAADISGNYDVTVLPGNPSSPGSYLSPVDIQTGRTILTGLAMGFLKGTGQPDLVATANDGAVVLVNNSTASAISFVQGQVLSAQSISAAAVGFVDLDAIPDVVLTTKNNGGQVLLYQNVGGAVFGSPIVYSAGSTPVAVAIGDLNGDGLNDIVVANGTNQGAVSVLLNKTAGSVVNFSGPASYVTGSQPAALALNLVGGEVAQVVTANLTGNDATTLRTRADGVLHASSDQTAALVPPLAIAHGDLNGDGRADIVTASSLNGNLSLAIQFSQADGTYGAAQFITLGSYFGGTPPVLAIRDLTGTGVNDILVTNPTSTSAVTPNGTLTIISNNGSGNFAVVQTISVGLNPTGLTFGDFNADGRLDMALSFGTTGASGVDVMLGQGQKKLANPVIVDANTLDYVGIVSGDFIQDPSNPGVLDLAVLDGSQASQVVLYKGDGKGGFSQFLSPFAAGTNANGIVGGDLNGDGLLDVVVSNQVPAAAGAAATSFVTSLLGQSGIGFSPATIRTDVFTSAAARLQSISAIDLNGDVFPDLVLATTGSSDNLYTLQSVGDGSFTDIRAYEVRGGLGVGPSLLAVANDSFLRVTTFTVATTRVASNLVVNGSFDTRDLNGENGNLVGWNTFQVTNSAGGWSPQSGPFSPQGSTQVPAAPDGNNAAMLDQPVVAPYRTLFGQTTPPSVNGTNVLYQDVIVPAGATATLSLSLYLNSTAAFTDSFANPSLDYRTAAANQQVRIDIISPTGNILDVTGGVLLNVFRTTPTGALTQGYFTVSANLSQFAGQVIRLRIVGVNNRGSLVVGVDNVQILATYNDTLVPVLNGIRLRNPGFGQTANLAGNTTDPTIIGMVADEGGIGNIAYVEVDPLNNGFGNADDYFVTNVDALGNFQTTLPSVLPDGSRLLSGPMTVAFQVADDAGNVSPVQRLTFNFLGDSKSAWSPVGPGPTRYTGEGVNFNTVSGKINSLAVDPADPSGNTIYAATAGGIWKTVDGGADWTPLTDYLTDPVLGPVAVPAGYVAISPSQPKVLYAATGIADNEPLSRVGYGLVRSLDGGQTWQVVGMDAFVGARVSKLVASSMTSDGKIYLYAAVASGGQFGPGIYRSTDGGLTWTNAMRIDNMFRDAGGTFAANIQLASATDIVIDPFSNDQGGIWVGLGNIGLQPTSRTGGVWFSSNHGDTWLQILGGHDPKSVFSNVVFDTPTTIPSQDAGGLVGKVMLAVPTSQPAFDGTVYAYISLPPTGDFFQDTSQNNGTSRNAQATGFNTSSVGLYKTTNSGLSWTPIMVREEVPIPNSVTHFVNLFVSGFEAADVGALVVDTKNPNVIYFGGSERVFGSAQVASLSTNFSIPSHALLRIDTSSMRDTNYATPFPPDPNIHYPNNGDDILKALTAEGLSGTQPGQYPAGAPTNNAGYSGEGVFWYDLSSELYGQDFGPNFVAPKIDVPNAIEDIQIDSSGRLLVATDGGVYRARLPNFAYDFTSGGNGIMRYVGTATPAEPAPEWSDLNGNLQVSEVKSLAIDPYQRGVLHLSNAQTGWSLTTGQLSALSTLSDTAFVSGGFTFDSFSNDAFSTGDVVAAPGDPNAPAGTQSSVFRSFELFNYYVLQNTLLVGDQIEASVDQGGAQGTFVPSAVGLNTSGQFSPFAHLAIAPVLTATPQGDLEPTLMFNVSGRIFASTDGAQSWHPVSTDLVAQGASDITALSFGRTNKQFWVGTSTGQVFVDLFDGANNFPLANFGLPTQRINDITPDPNSDTTAYVVMGGTNTGQGHVFKTTNAGLNWTNITANLPDVAVLSFAIDPTKTPLAPQGTLYVGTEIGVYFSVNGGTTWSRSGNIINPDNTVTETMPHVPVSKLELDASNNILYAATLGRSVFSISTNNSGGPFVKSVSPGVPGSAGLSSVTVTFNEPVDPRSFTLAQVKKLTGPDGNIPVLAINSLDTTNDKVYQIVFPSQLKDGVYTITLSSQIQDFQSNLLDQNRNGVGGEPVADQFTVQFVVNSTDVGSYVSGAYNDLLKRASDTSGFIANITPLNSTFFNLLPQQALPVVTSDAARLAGISNAGGPVAYPVVRNFYPSILGRTANATESTFWLQQLKQGVSEEQLMSTLTGSDEFFNLAAVGALDSNYINQAFADILGRAPAGTELASNTQVLNQAEVVSRTAVSQALIISDEYRRIIIKLGYQTFLRRPASNTEIAAWLPSFRAGLSDQAFFATLIGSATYFKSSAIVTPGTPTGTNGTNASWLRAVYYDILGRALDSFGANVYGGMLNAGVPRATVALQLFSTPEYRARLIQSYYQTYLGRAADPASVASWQNALAHGARAESIVATLVSSTEYFQKNGGVGTNHPQQNFNWLSAVYQSVLQRPIDLAGQTAWANQLDLADVKARTGVASSLANSPEYFADLVTSIYQNPAYLGRSPGLADLAIWVNFLQQKAKPGATNEERFLASILGSGEFFYRARQTNGLASNSQWVANVYQALQVPSALNQANTLASLLNAYAGQRLATVTSLLNSAEYRNVLVKNYFQTLMKRQPTASELSTYTGLLASGASDQSVIAQIVTLSEYVVNATNGTGNNSLWLNQVYLDLLGRPRDAASSQGYLTGLGNGTLTRLGVATSILNSIEYKNRLITSYFTQFLGRTPTPGELSLYVGLLSSGRTDESIIAQLLDSNEYFLRSHPYP